MGFRVATGGVTNAAAERSEVVSANAGSGGNSIGARVFNANCAACHVDRTYYKGIYGTDQQAVETAIRGGGNNVMSMPAFDGVLTDAEISAVAEYVRQQNDWN